MPPKKRDEKNSDLSGTNIKVSVKNGKEYLYYVMPDGTHEPLAHGDRRQSIEAAHALNMALRPSGGVVDRIINKPPAPTTKNPSFIEVLNQFETEWLLKQIYSARSLSERRIRLNQYRREWPHTLVGDLATFDMAQFLRACTPAAAKQHRSLLIQIFRFAASSGYQTLRPMLEIERYKQPKRQRVRHTWDGHMAIYNASPPWLQRAIKIALHSLQRRSDMLDIKIKEDINIEKRTIRILQQKSRNYETPVYIDIEMGEELFEVVMLAIKSDVLCPYLVHCRPKRFVRGEKPHPFAVTGKYLSDAYAEIRDSIGVYNHLPKIKRPGIHSLRALGIWLYTKAGHSDEYIMALAGHATEKMKSHYTDGHELSPPVRVSAGLSTKNIDLSNINWSTDLSTNLLKLADSTD